MYMCTCVCTVRKQYKERVCLRCPIVCVVNVYYRKSIAIIIIIIIIIIIDAWTILPGP
jgi:hypothetical protein